MNNITALITKTNTSSPVVTTDSDELAIIVKKQQALLTGNAQELHDLKKAYTEVVNAYSDLLTQHEHAVAYTKEVSASHVLLQDEFSRIFNSIMQAKHQGALPSAIAKAIDMPTMQ